MGAPIINLIGLKLYWGFLLLGSDIKLIENPYDFTNSNLNNDITMVFRFYDGSDK